MNLLFASYNFNLFNEEKHYLDKLDFKSILFDISSVFGSVMHLQAFSSKEKQLELFGLSKF